jgi:hypothetical protein
MQEDQVETMLLYKLESSKNLLNILIGFQVYPGMYDSVTIIHQTRRAKIGYHVLDRFQTPKVSIDAYDHDGIIVLAWNNGFLYAGGIWQVRWSHESERHFLRCTCATGIDVVEVATLLSTEELDLIEQAISAAFDFWQKQFSDAILVFISCEEVHGSMLKLHRQEAHEGQFDWQREITWRITLHRFTFGGPNPVRCRALVHYHPERQDEYFTLEEPM